jgi:hypothetical protein
MGARWGRLKPWLCVWGGGEGVGQCMGPLQGIVQGESGGSLTLTQPSTAAAMQLRACVRARVRMRVGAARLHATVPPHRARHRASRAE